MDNLKNIYNKHIDFFSKKENANLALLVLEWGEKGKAVEPKSKETLKQLDEMIHEKTEPLEAQSPSGRNLKALQELAERMQDNNPSGSSAAFERPEAASPAVSVPSPSQAKAAAGHKSKPSKKLPAQATSSKQTR